jgi:Xaa-Pro aminopeptidase
MKKSHALCGTLAIVLLAAGLAATDLKWTMSGGDEIRNILPERERAVVFNRVLEWRLDNILPKIMRREGIDLWIVISFEYAEDPVYMTLVPRPVMSARRVSILLFHDAADGFRKLTANWHGSGSAGSMYTSIFTPEYRAKGANGQFTAVADYIREADPKAIGINTAGPRETIDDFSHGLGLTAFYKEKLERSLDPEYRGRLVSAEKVCVGWFETRSPEELSLYRQIAGISHGLIREFFSNRVITPDVTTTDDVVWWIRQRITDLGLETWFQPSISIQRSPSEEAKYGKADRVIRRGDLLHCDIGISYLGLCTDMQHNAYVLRLGEEDAPAGLREILRKANRVQEILLTEFAEGRTGNEILRSALEKAKAEGLGPRIYTHPVGFYGHGSGMTIGMTEKQDFVPGGGEHPLHVDTVYAIELSASSTVPEWDAATVGMGVEDQGCFTEDGPRWVDGYPRTLYLIK